MSAEDFAQELELKEYKATQQRAIQPRRRHCRIARTAARKSRWRGKSGINNPVHDVPARF